MMERSRMPLQAVSREYSRSEILRGDCVSVIFSQAAERDGFGSLFLIGIAYDTVGCEAWETPHLCLAAVSASSIDP